MAWCRGGEHCPSRHDLPSHPVLQREPDREEQPEDNMPPKFKRHLNDDEVTGSIRSERVRHRRREWWCLGYKDVYVI